MTKLLGLTVDWGLTEQKDVDADVGDIRENYRSIIIINILGRGCLPGRTTTHGPRSSSSNLGSSAYECIRGPVSKQPRGDHSLCGANLERRASTEDCGPGKPSRGWHRLSIGVRFWVDRSCRPACSSIFGKAVPCRGESRHGRVSQFIGLHCHRLA